MESVGRRLAQRQIRSAKRRESRLEGDAASRRVSFDFPPVDKPRAYDCIDAMRTIADVHKVSVAQIALSWLLHQPVVSSVIIGAKTIQQLEDNIGATWVTLTSDELATLDKVSDLPAEYPGWMLDRQGD